MDGSAELTVITAVGITFRDVSPVYVSPDPYHSTFEERLDIRRYHAYGKDMEGMVFSTKDGRLALRDSVQCSEFSSGSNLYVTHPHTRALAT